MFIGDFTTPSANLSEALEKLEIAWAAVREHWDDPASRHFEEEHMNSIRPKVRCSMDSVARLSEVVGQARRDCEYRDMAADEY